MRWFEKEKKVERDLELRTDYMQYRRRKGRLYSEEGGDSIINKDVAKANYGSKKIGKEGRKKKKKPPSAMMVKTAEEAQKKKTIGLTVKTVINPAVKKGPLPRQV